MRPMGPVAKVVILLLVAPASTSRIGLKANGFITESDFTSWRMFTYLCVRVVLVITTRGDRMNVDVVQSDWLLVVDVVVCG